LKSLDYRALCRCSDGTKGWDGLSPFDGIVVTAGATVVPDDLLQQLRIPGDNHGGGRLVIPVGDRATQKMTRITRTGTDTFETEETEGFRFVPFVGAS
jgi:protein-L-isoaspartate(D-aspartate) O-methyltransferase